MEPDYIARSAKNIEVINSTPVIELPTTVSEIWDETLQKYVYTFSLDKDEKDAMLLFGLNPIVEIDGHLIRRAEAIIKTFAHKYATDCFNEKIPVDCFCDRTLFRRYCDKNKKI